MDFLGKFTTKTNTCVAWPVIIALCSLPFVSSCRRQAFTLLELFRGAEGTIVEGEDLSNMIWGLNVEDNQSRNGQVGAHQKNPPRLQVSPKLSAPPLPDHGPIDLSQLAVSREQYARENVLEKQSPIAPHCEVPAYGRILCAKVGHSKINEPGMQDWNRGLGLNWQDTIELLPSKQKISRHESEYSTLKPSAAPFIPSSSPASHFLPRIVVEPRFSDLVQNIRWPTILDQTANIGSYLSTPPDSSSPLWSPYISTPSVTDTVSPQIAYELPSDKQMLLSSFGTKNCVQDVDNWIIEKRPERRAVKDNYDSPVISTSPSAEMTGRGGVHETKGLTLRFTPESPTVNGILLQNNGQGIPTSPERRFRGISQQPRSIPLARLIQRRLSSVAEEDANALVDDATASPDTSRAVQGVSGSRNSDQPKTSPACQTIRETPSPDMNPQTCKQPNYEAMANEITSSNHELKAIVKLPSSNVGSAKLLGTVNLEEKENSGFHGQLLAESAEIAAKKTRNRKRTQSSSSAQSK